MATIKTLYGANNQAVTCTLASLASAAYRSSAAVDNTTNLFLDTLVTVKVTTGASGVSATGSVNVYAIGTTDGGATYGGAEAGMGTDATVTPTSPPNMVLVGIVNAVAASTVYQRTGMSVAAAFGGQLPDHWALCLYNGTGAALAATGNSMTYQGVQAQSV